MVQYPRDPHQPDMLRRLDTIHKLSELSSQMHHTKVFNLEYNISNGQLSDVTGSVHVMGRYLANAIVSDKSK